MSQLSTKLATLPPATKVFLPVSARFLAASFPHAKPVRLNSLSIQVVSSDKGPQVLTPMLSEHTGRDQPWVGKSGWSLQDLDRPSKSPCSKASVARISQACFLLKRPTLQSTAQDHEELYPERKHQLGQEPCGDPKRPNAATAKTKVPRTRSGHKVSAIDTRSRSRPCTQLNAASGPPSPFPRLTRFRRRSWPQDPSHIAAMLIRLVLDFRRGQ